MRTGEYRRTRRCRMLDASGTAAITAQNDG